MRTLLTLGFLLAFTFTVLGAQGKPAELNELETVKLQLAKTLIELAQVKAQLEQLKANGYALEVIKELEASRPGFKFNPQTGQFEPAEKKAPE